MGDRPGRNEQSHDNDRPQFDGWADGYGGGYQVNEDGDVMPLDQPDDTVDRSAEPAVSREVMGRLDESKRQQNQRIGSMLERALSAQRRSADRRDANNTAIEIDQQVQARRQLLQRANAIYQIFRQSLLYRDGGHAVLMARLACLVSLNNELAEIQRQLTTLEPGVVAQLDRYYDELDRAQDGGYREPVIPAGAEAYQTIHNYLYEIETELSRLRHSK